MTGTAPDAAPPRPPPPPPPPAAPRPRPWARGDTVALVAVVALAALVRLPRLSDPPSLVFDETYYAKDACTYVYGPAALCGVDVEQTQVHPPLGKWLIAAGIRVFGFDALGWRVGSALAGLVTVALLYVLARRLLGSTGGGTIAAGLLALDFLHFVQSRVAMLDVFAAMFTVAAALFVHLDRDRRPAGGRLRRIVGRPWLLAAGATAGAALASKWSGLLTVAFVVVLAAAWEWAAARRRHGRAAARAFATEGAPSLLLALGVVPLVVYVLSYVARLEGRVLAAPFAAGSWARALWDRQLYMLDFHRGLTDTHPYTSPPWSWPLIKRPVSYFFETGSAGDYLEIMAVGNPLVWWPSLAALAYVAARWRRTGGPTGAEAVVVAGFAVTYLPWLVLAGDRSAVFLFYLLPAVPFMCLAVAYAAVHLGWLRARPAVAAGALAVLASFLFYYPVLAKVPVTRGEWLRRIWVFDDCDRPTAPPRPAPSGEGLGSPQKPAEPEHVEPEGWCWI